MRVAVLADIHGNLPALEAVLRDVAEAEVDAIVLNGDIADGPMPGETMDGLLGLGDRAVWVRGNGERWLVEAYDGTFQPDPSPTSAPAEWFSWCAGRLTGAQRDRLADLPLTVTLDVDGLGPVAFCHATARDDNEFILVDSPLRHFHDAFGSLPERTVVVGHTHMPFDRLADTRRVINPGSVGMPYGHQGAAWALLGPDVVLRRTAYEVTEAAARMSATSLPGVQSVVDNVRASASDAEALTAFQATIDRQTARATAE